jgi:hypothetical protein
MEVHMSKKPAAKLTLEHDTLRRLDPAMLGEVRGGGWVPQSTTCPHIISVLIGL